MEGGSASQVSCTAISAITGLLTLAVVQPEIPRRRIDILQLRQKCYARSRPTLGAQAAFAKLARVEAVAVSSAAVAYSSA